MPETMSMRSRRALLLSLCLLAACDNSKSDDDEIIGDPTPEQLARLEENIVLTSGFVQPAADGTFTYDHNPIFTGSYKDGDGNGFAYQVGKSDDTFAAISGLLPGSTGGDLPLSGHASMSGAYRVAEIGKSNDEGREYGEAVVTNGRITLRADFSFGTLQGSDTESGFVVDGTFSTGALTGQVFYNERAATLSGQIGRERAIGAFHGTDSDTAMSGGFLVSR